MVVKAVEDQIFDKDEINDYEDSKLRIQHKMKEGRKSRHKRFASVGIGQEESKQLLQLTEKKIDKNPFNATLTPLSSSLLSSIEKRDHPIINLKNDHIYKKYHLKNKSNDKVRPFYLWKDGFIVNYKKI